MTKEEVLKLFERNRGEIISGEEVAQQLGMSRTAIWKAINLLREEGYDIESIRKKGYRLNPNSDILSVIKIREHLFYEELGKCIEVHKSIDSTNKRLKLLAVEGVEEWTIVASEQQSAGRGRGEKVFLSPEGKGVYMSILLRPYLHWSEKEELLGMINTSVKEVLEALTHLEIDNTQRGDLYIQGKKVAGILTEMIIEAETERIEGVIVGIGINVYDKREENQKDDIKIALSDVLGAYCNRSEIIASILNNLYGKIINKYKL